MTRVLTAKRSNTDKHGIGKINITLNIRILRNNNLHDATRSWDRELLRLELRLRSYDFLKVYVIK
jgi:hypothetical protein